MKRILRFWILTMAMVIVQVTFAQENNDITDIAFDYLLQNIKSVPNCPWKLKLSACEKMPNGGYLVKMKIQTVVKGKVEKWVDEVVYSYGGYTFDINKKKVYKDSETEYTSEYFVFMDRNGKPIKHVQGFFGSDLKFWQGNIWVLMKRSVELGGKYYDAIDFYRVLDYNGNELSSMQGLCTFLDWVYTGKTLYLVGNYSVNHEYYSIVRTIDMETNEQNDRLGEKKDVAYGIKCEDDAIRILLFKDNKERTSFTIPYAAKDRDYQIQQVIKKYDLRKVSDQIALGERYLNGNIVNKDEKKAAELFEKAANQNSDIGMVKLAECYKKGIGVTQDNAKAFSLYEKATNLGNTDAMIALSDMYAEGVGVAKDISKALFWKEKLAFNGNSAAQKYVVANYQSVEYEKYNITADEVLRIARDNQKNYNCDWAEFCYKRAISLGSKDAMFDYGKWLYEGGGIAKDCDKAIEYLSQLGEENHVNAQGLLRKIYKENKGVVPDVKKEMYWATKAAENGDTDSQVLLGAAYLNGNGVSKNKKLSAEWYEKAAMQNHQDATRITIVNYMNGNGVKKNMDKATYFFTHLDKNTQLQFADNVFNGVGMKKNQKLAASMYWKMALNGDINAKKKIAFCFLDGVGVSKSIERAYELAMEIRNTTHNGEDGDIYYIEAKYLEKKYSEPNGMVADSYRRAIKYGCSRAVTDFARYQKKYGLHLDINGRSY